MGLSPMLVEAEKERQKDTEECEENTRCKVSKGTGRYSSYEYTDIDTGRVVSLEEYNRRYLRHVYRKKAGAFDTLRGL